MQRTLLLLLLLCLSFHPACADDAPAPGGDGPDLVGPTPGERPLRALPDTGTAFPPALKAVLENADTIELFAMDPESGTRTETIPTVAAFHDYRFLNRAPLEDSGLRHELVRLYYQAVFRSEGRAALCFLPRHALRATRGAEQVDVLACFECLQLRWWGPGSLEGSATIDDGDVAALDELYARAGLTIARND